MNPSSILLLSGLGLNLVSVIMPSSRPMWMTALTGTTLVAFANIVSLLGMPMPIGGIAAVGAVALGLGAAAGSLRAERTSVPFVLGAMAIMLIAAIASWMTGSTLLSVILGVGLTSMATCVATMLLLRPFGGDSDSREGAGR